MYGRLTGRRLPFLNKAPEEGLKVSALCGGRNGLYLEGSICGIPCLMLVDTGANVTLVRTLTLQGGPAFEISQSLFAVWLAARRKRDQPPPPRGKRGPAPENRPPSNFIEYNKNDYNIEKIKIQL
ncbi:hypothetical protein AVEN_82354-1 [Araneus ventricosus]|uniref:Uncharacterized protein n=1 Tax=Araneus ventricosus TaxID=182803 RepID=A0A4Y2IV08_ARAVE|nr:hypothetical protein AVEN_82354-1 [Araneus ventricosus]